MHLSNLAQVGMYNIQNSNNNITFYIQVLFKYKKDEVNIKVIIFSKYWFGK